MYAWLLAPKTEEGDASARLLEMEGWTVERLSPGMEPSGQPAVIVLLHAEPLQWRDLREALARGGGAPAIYVGSYPAEAAWQLPGVAAVFRRPMRGAVLKVMFSQLGLHWGQEPAQA